MDNVGGLRRISVVDVDCLEAGGVIKETVKLIDVPFIQESGRRKCVRKQDKTGVFYEVTIKCRLARSERDSLVDRFPEYYAVVTTDNNGVIIVDGSPDEPMRCETDSDTGEEFSDLNNVELQFNRKFRFFSQWF